MACSSVVLPTPLGPVSTVTEPGRTSVPSTSMSMGAVTVLVPPSDGLDGVEQPECVVGGGLSVLRGVELHPDPAQRPEHLGGQQQRGQPGGQRHLAEHQPQADAHGDHRDTEGGEQFQHQRGQERDAQRRHRRTPMCRTQFGDPVAPIRRCGPAPEASGCRRPGRAVATAGWSSRPATPPTVRR